MIWNIIDRRKRPYRWKRVNAIIEAVEHDNSCPDADQAPEAAINIVVDYDQRESISIEDAVLWASQQDCAVTLYLYDVGDGIANAGHFNAVGERFNRPH
jgi:hypothetical protein